jgi:hypothetical protein
MTARPRRNDKAIMMEVARRFLPTLLKYLGEKDDPKEHDFLVDKLSVIFSYNSDCDSFKLAKDIEKDLYIDGDSELVEICDDIYAIVQDVYDGTLDLWIKVYNLKPKFNTGDKFENVEIKLYGIPKEPQSFEIVEIDNKRGRYYVEGSFCKKGSSRLIDWEILEEAVERSKGNS